MNIVPGMAVQKWKLEVRAVKREVFMIIIIMFRIYGNNVNIILCPQQRTCAESDSSGEKNP